MKKITHKYGPPPLQTSYRRVWIRVIFDECYVLLREFAAVTGSALENDTGLRHIDRMACIAGLSIAYVIKVASASETATAEGIAMYGGKSNPYIWRRTTYPIF